MHSHIIYRLRNSSPLLDDNRRRVPADDASAFPVRQRNGRQTGCKNMVRFQSHQLPAVRAFQNSIYNNIRRSSRLCRRGYKQAQERTASLRSRRSSGTACHSDRRPWLCACIRFDIHRHDVCIGSCREIFCGRRSGHTCGCSHTLVCIFQRLPERSYSCRIRSEQA